MLLYVCVWGGKLNFKNQLDLIPLNILLEWGITSQFVYGMKLMLHQFNKE